MMFDASRSYLHCAKCLWHVISSTSMALILKGLHPHHEGDSMQGWVTCFLVMSHQAVQKSCLNPEPVDSITSQSVKQLMTAGGH